MTTVLTETQLLERINVFRARHDDMAPTTFGRNATGEPQLIRSIENGRSPSLSVVNRILDYMARTDAEAETRAKLTAPMDGPPPEQEETELPFCSAPVTTDTGASSLTSSPMNGHPSLRAANPRSPSSCDPDHGTAGPLPPFEAGQTRAEGRTPGAPPVLSDREA